MPTANFRAVLQAVSDHGIGCILVGGLAAVLNGAPVHTFDVDLVYSLDPENVDRLLNFCDSLDAIFRIQPERKLRPNRTHLSAGGHLNLLTRHGPVDLLGFIGDRLAYPALLAHSPPMRITPELTVRVLDLETLIMVKEFLSTEKDLAVLPVLRQTLKATRA